MKSINCVFMAIITPLHICLPRNSVSSRIKWQGKGGKIEEVRSGLRKTGIEQVVPVNTHIFGRRKEGFLLLAKNDIRLQLIIAKYSRDDLTFFSFVYDSMIVVGEKFSTFCEKWFCAFFFYLWQLSVSKDYILSRYVWSLALVQTTVARDQWNINDAVVFFLTFFSFSQSSSSYLSDAQSAVPKPEHFRRGLRQCIDTPRNPFPPDRESSSCSHGLSGKNPKERKKKSDQKLKYLNDNNSLLVYVYFRQSM